jgi:TonB family protein
MQDESARESGPLFHSAFAPVGPGGSEEEGDRATEDAARAMGTPCASGMVQLSSWLWKYATFFDRVGLQVRGQWHPDVDFKARDPYATTYGMQDRCTVLAIPLGTDGHVSGPIEIAHSSGLNFLDQDAVDAVRQAAPFLNPPPGMFAPARPTVVFKLAFFFEID